MAIKTKRSPGKSSGVKPKNIKPFQYAPGSVNPYLNNPSFPGYSGDDMYDPAALRDYRYQPWYPSAFPSATVPTNAYYNPTASIPGSTPATSTPGQTAQVVPNWNPQSDPYAWRRDASGNLGDGMYPGSALPEGWTSTYSPEAYMYDPANGIYGKYRWKQPGLQWLGGGASGEGMGSRQWRMPGRYRIPEQQVKKDANGNVWAERPEWDRRTRMQKFLDKVEEREDGEPNVAPMWTGQLVNWRT